MLSHSDLVRRIQQKANEKARYGDSTPTVVPPPQPAVVATPPAVVTPLPKTDRPADQLKEPTSIETLKNNMLHAKLAKGFGLRNRI